MRKKTKLWIVLHALVVLVPLFGAVLRAPDADLYGVEPPAPAPLLSLRGWMTEKVQPAFQSWFESRIGFRGVMVRTDNSLQIAALNETPPGSFVVIGDKDVYFSRDDVEYMSTQRRDMPFVLARVEDLTRRLGSVHRKLGARGKRLAVVMSPSKTDVYGDAVPTRWRRPLNISHEIHDALRSGLTENGVPFGDGNPLFKALPKDERELVFARYGRHWTVEGSCLALNEALAKTPFVPSCEYDMIAVSRASHFDFDLFKLQNNWGCDLGRAEVPKTRPPKLEDDAPTKPRTLFVGTSFLWMLVTNMRPLIAEKPVALFYNTTFFDIDSWTRIGAVDPAAPAWADYVLERDLYVLDILDTFAHHDEMLNFVTELDRRLN